MRVYKKTVEILVAGVWWAGKWTLNETVDFSSSKLCKTVGKLGLLFQLNCLFSINFIWVEEDVSYRFFTVKLIFRGIYA